MMKSGLTYVSDTTAAGGLAIGLTNIYTILGIVLTIISIIVLIINFSLRMIYRLKDKNFTEEERKAANNEISELTEKVQYLQNELNKFKKE